MFFLRILDICKNQVIDIQSITINKSPVLAPSERYAVAFDIFLALAVVITCKPRFASFNRTLRFVGDYFMSVRKINKSGGQVRFPPWGGEGWG